MAEDTATEGQTEKKPSLVKKLALPLALVILASGGTFAGLKFSGLLGSPPEAVAEGDEMAVEGDAPAVDTGHVGKPAFFFTLYPDLLVNFKADGKAAYLKLAIDVMSHDETVIQGVEQYHAIVRNNLLAAFQQVQFDTSKRQESIEAMRTLATDEVKMVLAKYHGSSDVEGVYFTSFVVQ